MSFAEQEIMTRTSTPIYRLVHAQDPVPHAPPILLNFWHAPFEIFYNKVGKQGKEMGGGCLG